MSELKSSYHRYCELLTMAESYYSAGESCAAVRIAQLAARIAYPGNIGMFGSPRLEQLLLNIGQQIPSPNFSAISTVLDKSRRNVLHVLSYGRPIGGDTRFVWRWIREDKDSRHFVAITTQADMEALYEFPDLLKQAVEDSGGLLWILKSPTSRPLEQAYELRQFCQGMDIVALHLFPYDVIPILAFAKYCDAMKTLFINHSDHTFWIGSSIAHKIVHLRWQFEDFLKIQRGLSLESSANLPIPLDYSEPKITKHEAKIKLGYDAETVLLLTIATPFKYSAKGQIGFLDVVLPVLIANPQAVLLAIGPENKGFWKMANEQTQGRVIAFGARWDTEILYNAADIYLDSIPFSSITSILEAGMYKAALLGYQLPNSDLAVLGPGAPGLDESLALANDTETYRTMLTELILDSQFREQRGQIAQYEILKIHTGRGWLDGLNKLYDQVKLIENRNCLVAINDNFAPTELNLALIRLYKPWNERSLIRYFISILPYITKIKITWHLKKIGFCFCFENFLPAPIFRMLSNGAKYLKKLKSKRKI